MHRLSEVVCVSEFTRRFSKDIFLKRRPPLNFPRLGGCTAADAFETQTWRWCQLVVY